MGQSTSKEKIGGGHIFDVQQRLMQRQMLLRGGEKRTREEEEEEEEAQNKRTKLSCSVCMGPLEPMKSNEENVNDEEAPIKLSCGHSFHKGCICEWFNAPVYEYNADTNEEYSYIPPEKGCPMCRKPYSRFEIIQICGFGRPRNKAELQQWLLDWQRDGSRGAPNDWDVSKITDMSNLFDHPQLIEFNQPIRKWNTSNVTDMSQMFAYARLFQRPIENWDTGNVTTMSGMFAWATAFNKPIGDWDTSNVTDMSAMFKETAFNQPLDYCVDQRYAVLTPLLEEPLPNEMLREILSHLYPVAGWNTGNVTDMSQMFAYARAFNQPIGNWNTTNVTNMLAMFQDATTFNQNLAFKTSGYREVHVQPLGKVKTNDDGTLTVEHVNIGNTSGSFGSSESHGNNKRYLWGLVGGTREYKMAQEIDTMQRNYWQKFWTFKPELKKSQVKFKFILNNKYDENERIAIREELENMKLQLPRLRQEDFDNYQREYLKMKEQKTLTTISEFFGNEFKTTTSCSDPFGEIQEQKFIKEWKANNGWDYIKYKKQMNEHQKNISEAMTNRDIPAYRENMAKRQNDQKDNAGFLIKYETAKAIAEEATRLLKSDTVGVVIHEKVVHNNSDPLTVSAQIQLDAQQIQEAIPTEIKYWCYPKTHLRKQISSYITNNPRLCEHVPKKDVVLLQKNVEECTNDRSTNDHNDPCGEVVQELVEKEIDDYNNTGDGGHCGNMKFVAMPFLNGQLVEMSLSLAKMLRDQTLSSWDTSNVKDMTNMFTGATAFEPINIENWKFHADVLGHPEQE